MELFCIVCYVFIKLESRSKQLDRAFDVFVGRIEASLEIVSEFFKLGLGFRNLGSLAVGQTDVTLLIWSYFELDDTYS